MSHLPHLRHCHSAALHACLRLLQIGAGGCEPVTLGWIFLWRCVVVALGLCGGMAPAQARPLDQAAACAKNPRVALQTVLPGLAVVHGQWPAEVEGLLGHAATSVVLGQGREVTVMDPGPTQKVGLTLQSTLRCQGQDRVTAVINTHAHAEQVLGNAAFHAPVLATAGTAMSMKARCPACLRVLRQELGAKALQGTRIVWPRRTLRDGQQLQAGGRTWHILEMTLAHTESDLVLWSPPEGIVLVGGLVDGARIPVLAQGRVLGWVQALDALQALQARWLVGQGTVQGPGQVQDAIERQRAYLCGLVNFAWQGLEHGWSEAEVLQGAVSPVLWPLETASQAAAWQRQHLFNQLRAWREMERLWMDRQAGPQACSSVPDVAR